MLWGQRIQLAAGDWLLLAVGPQPSAIAGPQGTTGVEAALAAPPGVEHLAPMGPAAPTDRQSADSR